MPIQTETGHGVRKHYGIRELNEYNNSRATPNSDYTKELILTFDYEDVNSGGQLTAARDFNGVATLPANSFIVKATLEVTTAFTSGGAATLTIGLVEPDGTAIDADGIDAAIALTAIDAVGERVLCDGALVGALAGIGTAAGQIIATFGTAAFTAGAARLIVEYQEI